MKRRGVFAGSFDPFTNGHLYILTKASKLFDEVIVLIMQNPDKKNILSLETRIELIKEIIKPVLNARVDSANGYTVDYANKVEAQYLIRGIRNIKDMDFELKLAMANKELAPNIETVFIMADKEHEKIASSKIIEMFINGKDISTCVDEIVIKALKNQLKN